MTNLIDAYLREVGLGSMSLSVNAVRACDRCVRMNVVFDERGFALCSLC